MNKSVVVLILSFNGKNLLSEAIDSYLNNDYKNFQIIVIDNGSTDNTKEYVENKWSNVEVLRTEKNLGYAGGFNFGMKYAFLKKNADYVLISNNDVKAASNTLSDLVQIAERDESIGFVTGKVYFYDYPDKLQTVGFFEDKLKWIGGHLGNKETDVGQYDKIEERAFSDDVFMLVRKELFEQTKGFDPVLQFQAEQLDWQARAKEKGFKIYFTPHAKIWHKESMTIGKASPFKTYFDVRNKLIVRLKHKDKDFIKNYYRWYLKKMVIKPLIKTSLKFQFRYTIAIIKGYFSALRWAKNNDSLHKLK